MKRNSQSGVGLIEVMMAAIILVIAALTSMILVSMSIANNSRNKTDSTQTMLVNSIVEQVTSTIIGSGTSSLTDCDGKTWTINTAPGGATVADSKINFSQASPPADYFMNYSVKTPCASDGEFQAVYDVRWNVQIVGAPLTPTNTFLITVGAQKQGLQRGKMLFPPAVNVRLLAGN